MVEADAERDAMNGVFAVGLGQATDLAAISGAARRIPRVWERVCAASNPHQPRRCAWCAC